MRNRKNVLSTYEMETRGDVAQTSDRSTCPQRTSFKRTSVLEIEKVQNDY